MPHQLTTQANSTRPPPQSAYNGTSSGDEYLSGDEDLSDHELDMLNSDYAFHERDLDLLPGQHQARYRRPSDTVPISEKTTRDPELGKPSSIPSRGSSLRHRDGSISSHDPQNNSHPQSRAYQYPSHSRRPLIDYIKNEWQQAALHPSSSSKKIYDDHFNSPSFIQICCAPRLQRSVLILFVLLLIIFGNWKTWVGPSMHEQYRLRQSSAERLKYADGWFGGNQRPEFADVVHLDTLDQELVPGSPDASPKNRRLIAIGDVHGCNEECTPCHILLPMLLLTCIAVNVLLSEVKYKVRSDHLIFVGDLIKKGPNSAAVIDLAISHNASCVRGNHEDRVLLTYRDLAYHLPPTKKDPPPMPGVPEDAAKPSVDDAEQKLPGDHVSDRDNEELSRLDILDRAHARQLTKQHVEYLSRCPTILDVGSVPGLGNVHVVHAGLIPSVDLERQDPLSVMQMRTVDLETHVPSSGSKGTPWYKVRLPIDLPSTQSVRG